MIERIAIANRQEAVEVLTAAFRDHPMMPPDPTGKKARIMMETFLRVFGDAPDAQVFGVRSGGRLGCVGFVYADGHEPGWLSTAWLVMRMIRAFGLKQCRTFMRVMSEKHTIGEKRLELLLLGTLAEFQGKGLGRRVDPSRLRVRRRAWVRRGVAGGGEGHAGVWFLPERGI